MKRSTAWFNANATQSVLTKGRSMVVMSMNSGASSSKANNEPQSGFRAGESIVGDGEVAGI